MSDLLASLQPKERRGSKPRCHMLTHGSSSDVAARLSAIAAPYATVGSHDRWMPQGFADLEEAQLHRAPRLLDPKIGQALRSWWLPADSRNISMTPNLDVASTCTIGGVPGLLLVEAKAHDEELNNEIRGRPWSEERAASHETIGAAIETARAALEHATSLRWKIARDTHYQMSNRFAWAWKLTELGFPVVLVYLGFLRANEMTDRGTPFADHAAWERFVKSHSQALFPEQVWGRQWTCHGRALVPLVRSLEVGLN